MITYVYIMQIIPCAIATMGGVIASRQYIFMKRWDTITERGYLITYGGWMSWIVLLLVSTMVTIIWLAQLR